MAEIKRIALLEQFSCLGAQCEDTCCQGWQMQLDDAHLEKYKQEAPQLLEATDTHEGMPIMRRDPKTDFCVKFTDGMCGIHAEKGTDFLGDACHFYPRSTKHIGNTTQMTAAFSCPEVVRLMLAMDAPFSFAPAQVERLPQQMRQYAPEPLASSDAATQCMQALIAPLQQDALSSDHYIQHLYCVARSLDAIDTASWADAAPFYMRTAAARLLPPEPHFADSYRLFHCVVALVGAAPKVARPRLEATLDGIMQPLHIAVSWDTLSIECTDDPQARVVAMFEAVQPHWPAVDSVLKRWLEGQIVLHAFPFAGMGDTVADKALFIAVRYAIMRLALMAEITTHGKMPDEATMVRIVQSLARVLDHLADATFSKTLYHDAGWGQEARLMGMLAMPW